MEGALHIGEELEHPAGIEWGFQVNTRSGYEARERSLKLCQITYIH